MVKVLKYVDLETLANAHSAELNTLENELVSLFKEMDAQVYNGAFKEENGKASKSDDTSVDSYIRNKILINQRRDELGAGPAYKSRFYRPYTDLGDYYKSSRYQYPDFLSTKNKFILPSKEEYEAMSDEEKTRVYANLLKERAIVSARRANLANRGKDSEQANSGGKNAYQQKDVNMVRFILRATKYNELVPETEQIYFGFNKDVESQGISKSGNPYKNWGLTLDASIPGYTRLSLHFGREVIPIIRSVNVSLKKANLPEFPIVQQEVDKYNDMYATAKSSGKIFRPLAPNRTIQGLENCKRYNLPRYVTNLGLLVSDNYGNIEQYVEQLKEKALKFGNVNTYGIERFIKFMHPDLNEREVMEIAERAGFGTSVLIKIQRKTNERGEYISNPIGERKKYVEDQLNRTKNSEQRKRLLKELGEDFFVVSTMEEKDSLEIIKEFLDITGDLVENKNELAVGVTTIVDKLLVRDADDTDKILRLLPYANLSNGPTLTTILKKYRDDDVGEFFVNAEGKFEEETYKKLVMLVGKEQKERLQKIAAENEAIYDFPQDTTNLYSELLRISRKTSPEDRKKAESIEQSIVEKNIGG